MLEFLHCGPQNMSKYFFREITYTKWHLISQKWSNFTEFFLKFYQFFREIKKLTWFLSESKFPICASELPGWQYSHEKFLVKSNLQPFEFRALHINFNRENCSKHLITWFSQFLNSRKKIAILSKHSVGISKLFCHSDFTWNQFRGI